jgi:hypothetical protein
MTSEDRHRRPGEPEMAPWRAATTLAELGELTAQWLEGDQPWVPGNAVIAPPNDETLELVHVLAALDRTGRLITTNSQPAYTDNESRQRAWLEILCDWDLAVILEHESLATDFVLLIQPPWDETPAEARAMLAERDGYMLGPSVPISMHDGQACTWAAIEDPAGHAQTWGALGDHTLAITLALHTVVVIDPVWGRNDLLWPWLTEVTTR